MDQKTFHALYEQAPPEFKAEPIGGIVYLPSPTSWRHGRPHARVIHWLSTYADFTPGTDVGDNTTNILGEESEPQPDSFFAILPEYGGQIRFNDEEYVTGAAELVAGVANTSAAVDLHRKSRDYERAGVREYYVALVEDRTVIRFVLRSSRLVERKPDSDAVLHSAVFPGLWLDPATDFTPSTQRMHTLLREGVATPEHAAFVAKLEAKRAALAKKKR